MWAGNFNVTEQRANTVYLGSLSKPGRTALFDARSNAVYADGRVYYADENSALASVSLDIASARITSAPRIIAPKVARSPSTFYTAIAAGNSTLVYSATSATNHSQLTWFDESGNAVGRVGPVGVLANPALSPDGSRVAFDSHDAKDNNVDVWILDLRNGGVSRFTFAPEEETMPVWSRDGSSIVYRAQTSVAASLYVKRVNGLESPRRVDEVRDDIISNAATSWSTDDRELLCMSRTPRGATDLMILLPRARKMRPFIVAPGIKSHGQISPDGKWVAYASNEGGEWEIYVTTYPDANGKWQVSRAGGTEPRWRGDSKALFYIGPQQMLTEAAVSTDGVFSTTATRPLFTIRARPPISYTDLMTYDVTRDGKRFLVNQYVRPAQAPPLNIVIHAGSSPAK
jgi:Tol biopolymer transport system component